MSRYWIVTRETESLLIFKDVGDLLIFLYDHQQEMHRFRILKNKGNHVVEIHLSHMPWSSYKEVLERS